MATTPNVRQQTAQPTGRPAARPATPEGVVEASTTEPAVRFAMISEAAYFLAERRGFRPGHELDDWLTAERQIDPGLPAGGDAERRAGPGQGDT